MVSYVTRQILAAILFTVLIGCNSSKKSQEQKKDTQTDPQTPTAFVQKASFTDFSGDKVALSDYKGKVVLIDFWESWCRPCVESFPTLEKLQEEYPQKFKVLAVNTGFSDSKADAESFAKSHDYKLTFLLDSSDLHSKLNVSGLPYKVFVDPDGQYIKKIMGSHGPEADYNSIKQIIEKHS